MRTQVDCGSGVYGDVRLEDEQENRLRLSMETEVYQLPLSTKEHKALKSLGVRTVGEFLQLDPHDVFRLRGYGARTYSLLKRSRDDLRQTMREQHRESSDDQMPRPQAPSSPIDIETFLMRDVAAIRLNTRALAALRNLGVSTVHAFLDLDLTTLPRLPNCGETTILSLQRAQEHLRQQFAELDLAGAEKASDILYSTERSRIAAAKNPATLGSWAALPFFRGEPLNGVTAAELHPSYRPDTSVEQLDLSECARCALTDAAIHTVGELLLTPYVQFLGPQNFGNATLTSLRSAMAEFRKALLEQAAAPEVDYSSPEAFLVSLIRPVLSNERQRQILLLRMGCEDEPRTAVDLAKVFGVTRERIRQIEKKAQAKLLHLKGTWALAPLHDSVSSMLKEHAPLLSFGAVCRLLQRQHGWARPLRQEALARLLPVFSDLRCVPGGYVCFSSFRCPECEFLPQILEAVIDDTNTGEIDLAALSRTLVDRIGHEGTCRGCDTRPERASVDLVRIAFNASETLKSKYRMSSKALQRIDMWHLAEGTISSAIEVVLKRQPRPMSYKDIQAELNLSRKEEISAEVVWRAANVCASQTSDILLWDRGGLYQHRCHVNLYMPVLDTMEEWLVGSLMDGPFTQLSTHAALQEFREECAAAGLSSEYAIHSCLKQRQHPKLVFFHSPYIGLAGAPCRLTNIEIAEELIRAEGEIVKLETLKDMLCRRMGLKRFQFKQVVQQLDSVIRTEGGFLHVDYFDHTPTAFAALVAYVKQRLSQQGHLSAELMYQEKRDTCLQLQIDGPRMLHSVLRQFAKDIVGDRSYPLLERVSVDDTKARKSIRDRVSGYIRDKQRPVSIQELHQRFVKKRGFGYATVMAVASTPVVRRYLSGMLVHVDTIAWDASKQSQLLDIAERYYDEQIRAGALFARADMLLELHEPELPLLAHGVHWTPLLITNLLADESRVHILGNRRNAFVFDSEGFASFADFIALVLERHFAGAANLVDLSEFLRAQGVIIKALTPKMLEDTDSLVVTRYKIAVKGRS